MKQNRGNKLRVVVMDKMTSKPHVPIEIESKPEDYNKRILSSLNQELMQMVENEAKFYKNVYKLKDFAQSQKDLEVLESTINNSLIFIEILHKIRGFLVKAALQKIQI